MTEWILTSSLLILTVTALRAVLKGRISLRLQYALWLVVLVRLLLPGTLFESRLSVLNLLERENAPVSAPTLTADSIGERDWSGAAPAVPVSGEEPPGLTSEADRVPVVTGGAAEPTVTRRSLSGEDIFTVVRRCGMAAVGLCLLGFNLHFWLRLRRTRRPLEPMEGRRVYVVERLVSPCVFGLFRPAIYLTPDVAAEPERLHHVLTHERTHLAHGDHIWALLRSICVALHWYNPLVWMAAALARRDAELACDEGAIRRLGEDQRIAYGRTLIRLVARRRTAGDLLSVATTMTGGRSSIRERITLIAKRPRTLLMALPAVLLIVAVAVGCTFTGADGDEEMTAPSGPAGEGTAGEAADLSVLEGRYGCYAFDSLTYLAPFSSGTWDFKAEQMAGTQYEVTEGVFSHAQDGSGKAWTAPVYVPEALPGEPENPLLHGWTHIPEPILGRFRIENEQEDPTNWRLYVTEDGLYAEHYHTANGYDVANFICRLTPDSRQSGAGVPVVEQGDPAAEPGMPRTVDDSLTGLPQPVLEIAWSHVSRDIQYWEQSTLGSGTGGVVITEAKLTGLTPVRQVYDAGVDLEITLYRLEYRLKPEQPESVPLAGGSELEDGWLTERSSMGTPLVLVRRSGSTYTDAGVTYTGTVGESGLTYDLVLSNCWESVTGARLARAELEVWTDGAMRAVPAELYSGDGWSLYLTEDFAADERGGWTLTGHPEWFLSVTHFAESDEYWAREPELLAQQLNFTADYVSGSGHAYIGTAGGTMKMHTMLQYENGSPAEGLEVILVPDWLGGCYAVAMQMPYEDLVRENGRGPLWAAAQSFKVWPLSRHDNETLLSGVLNTDGAYGQNLGYELARRLMQESGGSRLLTDMACRSENTRETAGKLIGAELQYAVDQTEVEQRLTALETEPGRTRSELDCLALIRAARQG